MIKKKHTKQTVGHADNIKYEKMRQTDGVNVVRYRLKVDTFQSD